MRTIPSAIARQWRVRKTSRYIAGYLDGRTEFISGPPLTRFSCDSSLVLCVDFGSSDLSIMRHA
jgi:hypothetical protein